VAKWLSRAINGHCWCTRTNSTIPKTLGRGSSGANFLFGFGYTYSSNLYCSSHYLQAYKHIFTSPSSVEKEVKATRSGNARIHGMTRVTTGSLAYVATQVCLASRFYQPTTDHVASFALRCRLRLFSVGLTLQRTLNGSMRASWNSWIIQMRTMTLAIC
jgi:hypothetical protein